MTKTGVYILNTVLLILTVPWAFTDVSDTVIFGMPAWSFYSFCLSVLYAVSISFSLGYVWKCGKKDAESDED